MPSQVSMVYLCRGGNGGIHYPRSGLLQGQCPPGREAFGSSWAVPGGQWRDLFSSLARPCPVSESCSLPTRAVPGGRAAGGTSAHPPPGSSCPTSSCETVERARRPSEPGGGQPRPRSRKPPHPLPPASRASLVGHRPQGQYVWRQLPLGQAAGLAPQPPAHTGQAALDWQMWPGSGPLVLCGCWQ